MWQAYHMAADHAAIGILGAIMCRELTGVGQRVDISVHQVVSTNTELDVPRWIYNRLPTTRSTTPYSQTKDGRFLYTLWGYPGDGHKRAAHLLGQYGLAGDLADEKFDDPAYRFQPDQLHHIQALIDRYVVRYKYPGPWVEAQAVGLVWAPMRRPEENLDDPHWGERQTFADVEHPELDRSLRYAVGRWYSDDVDWQAGPPAPKVGEHTDSIRAEISTAIDSSRGA
jgi:crotonobetainyl-CoA:carnitine CoA-transferase CaiB-like acyl-CoA transferase